MKKILIQIDNRFQTQIEETNHLLKQAGFKLLEKKASEQIWGKL